MNRSIQPNTNPIQNIVLPKVKEITICNQVPLYILETDSSDIIRFEIIFKSGAAYSGHPLVASFTSQMLQEGSTDYTAGEIAEKLDFLGTHYSASTDRDFTSLQVYSLSRNFEKSLKIIGNFLAQPLFPNDEFNTYLNTRKQRFNVDEEKVKTHASRKFFEAAFGTDHPYGRPVTINHFSTIDRGQLSDFHHRLYTKDRCKVILAGNISSAEIKNVETLISFLPDKGKMEKSISSFNPAKSMFHLIEKQNALQSAIRYGYATINKQHEDYPGLQILNTVLGGYFGSRLMSNIREDKGYTYGIGSVVASMLESGYFTVMTEVASQYSKATIDEITKEIHRLQTEKIPDNELEVVRNYLMGEFIRMFDGVYEQAESLRSIIDFNLNQKYFENYINKLKHITPDELIILAQRYLDINRMYTVIAGKYEN